VENQEVWKPVVGYEGIYDVSDGGRVRRVKPAQGTRAGQILKPIETKVGGYLGVHLHHAQGRKFVRIHRLVAEAFHGPSEMPLVRHLDGNPKNNVPSNLKFGTPQQNADDRVAHGRSSTSNQNTKKSHCVHGHEFTQENTKTTVNAATGRSSRKCRECMRALWRRKYWQDKAARTA